MTVYKVLTSDGIASWHLIGGEYEASNAQAAIKLALASRAVELGDDGPEEFVAIPARSWDPVKVEAKQAFSFS